MAKNLQTGASYKPLAENFDPRTTKLRDLIEAHASTLEESGRKDFISAFTGKTQFAPIFKEYLDRPAIDFVETFADDETNPLVKVYEKNEKVNPRRNMYSRVGAIEFHIKDQLTRAGVIAELFPEGMPMATDRVVRPDKPKAKARRYSYNPGLMGEWLAALDAYGRANPKDIGIVKALEAQAHMGLRTGEIMNAPASALVRRCNRNRLFFPRLCGQSYFWCQARHHCHRSDRRCLQFNRCDPIAFAAAWLWPGWRCRERRDRAGEKRPRGAGGAFAG